MIKIKLLTWDRKKIVENEKVRLFHKVNLNEIHRNSMDFDRIR